MPHSPAPGQMSAHRNSPAPAPATKIPIIRTASDLIDNQYRKPGDLLRTPGAQDRKRGEGVYPSSRPRSSFTVALLQLLHGFDDHLLLVAAHLLQNLSVP